MATIGNLAVKLSASAQGFVAGLEKAGKKVAELSDSLGALKSINSKLNVAFGALIGGSILGWIKGAADAVVATNSLARSIGATTEGVAALESAARVLGIAQGDVDSGLRAFAETVNEAATGSKDLGDAFGRLGLSATELAKLPTDEAFAKVAEKLNGIEDPTERAAAAYRVFGADAERLLPILTKLGEDGIGGLREQADGLAQSFSSLDASKVEAAQAALNRVWEIVDGIAKQIAIELSPYIIAASNAMGEFGGIGKTVAGWIVTGIHAVARGIAQIVDISNSVKIAFKGLGLAWDFIKLGIAKGLEELFALAAKLPASLGGNKFAGIRDSLHDFNADLVHSIDKTVEEIRDLAKSNTDAVDEFFRKMEEGANRAATKIDGIKSAGGALQKAVINKKLFDLGSKVLEEAKTPLETFQERLSRLDALLRAGSVTWDVYAKSAAAAVMQLEKAHQISEMKLPTAVTRGSAEATSAINQAANLDKQMRMSPQDRVQRILEQSLEIEKQQLEMAKRIATALGKKPKQAEIP